ncbi:MAG: L-histidine N(alpha)-methyltransferase [Cyanobacteria bacterium J06623_5]
MTRSTDGRLTVTDLTGDRSAAERLGQDVIDGLSAAQKVLPPKYFYDERGSLLFETICELPEYYPTRTETGILKAHSGAIAALTGACEIAELGSGSSTKTRYLLDAYRAAGHPLRYLPVDVSGTMLRATAQQLLVAYPALTVQALVGTYEPALAALPPKQLARRMIAFIGGTMGNLQPEECDRFLARVQSALAPGDYFLLGLDLQKETAILEAAYNDAQGVTAAFNLNMLRHLNGRFEGDFDLAGFSHVAYYNLQAKQIELYLESVRSQRVHLKALDLTVDFGAGDRILSEISRKFDVDEMTRLLGEHGLGVVETFTDEKRWFGLLLCQRR